MKLLFQLLGHLLVTFARLASPGGVRSVVAESLAVKHQLLITERSHRRAGGVDYMVTKASWLSCQNGGSPFPPGHLCVANC